MKYILALAALIGCNKKDQSTEILHTLLVRAHDSKAESCVEIKAQNYGDGTVCLTWKEPQK